MTKHEFMETLRRQLAQREVADIDDILQEYEDHFTFKQRDGYAEEEIAAKLGDPMIIAAQYDAAVRPAGRNAGLKIVAGTGLGFVDILSFSFLITLYAFSAVLAGLTLASLAIAVSYLFGFNPYALLPPMPYHCALLASVSMLSLAALSALGAYFWTLLVNQMTKAYLRYRRNFMAAATGSVKLPPYPVRVQTRPAVWRRLRTITLITLCAFVFSFLATFAVCALTAGAVGWWHAWNWFV